MTSGLRAAPWVLLVLIAGAGLGRGLWTPDEPREAGMSREMYAHPSVIPTLNGSPFVEKPPLYYLTVASAFALTGGPSVAGARGVSAAAALLTAVILFVWARRACSGDVARIAVLLFATSGAFLMSAGWVRIDALLMLCCTAAVASGWALVSGHRTPLLVACFYGALTLALWIKGLIGPVMIGAGVATYALFRGRAVLAPLGPAWGLAFGMVAVVALGLAIAWSGGRDALWEWAYVNHVERLVNPATTGHRQPIYYYLPVLPAMLLPWLCPFLDLFRPRARFWAAGAPTTAIKTYCGALVLGGLAVLTMSSTKREIYLLPIVPPLVLLMAINLADRIDEIGRTGLRGAWLRGAAVAQIALLVLVAVVPAAAWIYLRGGPGLSATIASAAAIAAALRVAAAARRRDVPAAVQRTLELAGVVSLAVVVVAGPLLDREKDFAPLWARIDARLPSGAPVYAVGADETLLGGVSFATGRLVVTLQARDLAGPGRDGSGPPTFVVVQSKNHDGVWPEITGRYDLVDAQDFGPERRISLWQLKAGPAGRGG